MNYQQPYNNFFKAVRIAFVGAVLMVSLNVYAAKGDSKIKKGVVLKFAGFDLKAVNNFNLFAKAGFLYRGNFSNIEKAPQATNMNAVVTFQKGNTTFIYPYKYKVKVPIFKTPAPVQR